MSYLKKCAFCETEFESSNIGAVYCSDECKRKRKNIKQKEYALSHKTIEKTCKCCGKNFLTNCNAAKFCSRSCAGSMRKSNNEKEKCRIRIIKSIPVFAEFIPKIGSVYEAEKADVGRGQRIYIIRSIGKHGICVRQDECEEVIE